MPYNNFNSRYRAQKKTNSRNILRSSEGTALKQSEGWHFKFPKLIVLKESQDRFDTVFKFFGVLLTAAGLVSSAYQFQVQQGTNEELEFKRRIWEKRLDAYMEIGNLSGRLVTTQAGTVMFDTLSQEFEQLYWGKMPLFEDDSVEYRMKAFHDELNLMQNGRGYPIYLKKKGLALMHACQKSLIESKKTFNRKE